MDDATRFTEAFTHLRTREPCRDRIGLLNMLLAEGINLGPRKMAETTSTHGFRELMRIARWHVEGDAFDRAGRLLLHLDAHPVISSVRKRGGTAMKTITGLALVLCASVWLASPAASQTPVGAPAINESQGDHYGWAVDYETGARATGYLHSSSMSSLRPAVAGQPTFRKRESAGAAPAASAVLPSASVAQEPRPASAEQDGPPRRAGDVFLDCGACPEMVVLAGGGLAMGRFEVTVGEYRAFASATGGGAGGGCITYAGDGDSWRSPGFSQTDHHPVMCVSWDDAQEYLSWLSRTTGATYRLPTESEWERAAAGSPTGCGGAERRTAFFAGSGEGTCEVGTNGINAAGLYDMVGNAWEWMSDCWEGDCGRRVVRGGSWYNPSVHLRPSARGRTSGDTRVADQGFRVLRMLD